jgi:CubicO group peptidase (beta-lactamase class C family)
VLVGVAIANGHVSLGDTATQHLGAGWTGRDDVSTEATITLEHLLSMTSGLGDAMEYVAAPGERWDYNLVAYPTVKRILTAAVGESLDTITHAWLTGPLGMTETVWSPRQWDDRFPAALRGAFFYPDGTPMEALVSTARDLAAFGHAVMSGCVGLGVDDDYRRRMTTSSQQLNPSYGLLWWVNAGTWPGVPADAFAAVGAGDQCCVVIPSAGLVVARTGQPADGTGLTGSEFVGQLAARTIEACGRS